MLHDPPHLELGQHHPPPIAQLRRPPIRTRLGGRNTLDKLHGQDGARGGLLDDTRNDDFRHIDMKLRHTLDILGLVQIVDLRQKTIAQLGPKRL